MKIIRLIISLGIIAISIYGLATKDFSYVAFAQLLLGFLFLLIGYDEIKNKKTGWGAYFIIGAFLIIVMAIFTF